jgi:hypothetical protein
MSKRKFEIGDTAIVNSKVGAYDRIHNHVSPGTEVIIKSYENSYSGSGHYIVQTPTGKNVRFFPNALDKTAAKTSIDKFQELINQAKEKIEKTQAFILETEAKITFLKEIKSDTFDENEFKAYHTLTIIEQGNMSKIEKAKAIAALISKK